jgi:hypothetical protein
MGRLHAAAEPGRTPDTVRVELIPGQGEEIHFVVEGGKAAAVEALDSRFARCGDSASAAMPPPAIP